MSNSSSLPEALQSWMETFMRRTMSDFLRYSRESGVSMHQFGALFYLHRKGVCGVSQVGEDLGVTNAAASQLIDKLVQHKLLERSEDPRDRRVKNLVLTQKGKDLISSAVKARHSWMEELNSRLTPEQQGQIISALDQLIEAAQEITPDEAKITA